MSMRSCVTKRGTGSNRRAWHPVFLLFACAAALIIVLCPGYFSLSAQEKTPDKKADNKQDIKPVKPAPSSASIEEERLKILNADIQAKLDEIKKLRQEIDAVSKTLEPKKKEQLVRVVKMYESMPAEEASKAIEKLDDDTAIQILTTLKSRNAGQILALMDPVRVASLSKKAILKARIPKEKSSP
jgi:flagellar motility protein MotE (MotC chaperone)